MGLLAGMMLSRTAVPPPYLDFDGVLVMAHRGGKGLWPENTLLAFRNAAQLGVHVLEMDLHTTQDGHLVILHDATVQRTTNGRGRVNQLTLSQVKSLDAGYRWSSDGGRTYPFRGRGITIPTLAEVFAAFPEHRLNIDIKDGHPQVVDAFCQAIKKHRMTNKVLAASFREGPLRRFRRQCPEVATAADPLQARLFFGASRLYLERVYTPGAHALQLPAEIHGRPVITPRLITAAHSRKLAVHAWTINNREDMQRLLEMGVDGIVTDYPDRLIALLDRIAGHQFTK